MCTNTAGWEERIVAAARSLRKHLFSFSLSPGGCLSERAMPVDCGAYLAIFSYFLINFRARGGRRGGWGFEHGTAVQLA